MKKTRIVLLISFVFSFLMPEPIYSNSKEKVYHQKEIKNKNKRKKKRNYKHKRNNRKGIFSGIFKKKSNCGCPNT